MSLLAGHYGLLLLTYVAMVMVVAATPLSPSEKRLSHIAGLHQT